MRDISRENQGFWYHGRHIVLSERAILLDGSLSEEEAADRPHVYRDIHAAFGSQELARAGAGRPVTLYIAPDVYWIDDPEAMDIMQKKEGYPLPFGMYVTCKALDIVGLSGNPEDVVIAGNRGQSHGCNGNYTMLHFQVEELSVSNITLGNYCSVDLAYPRNHALDHPRRTEAVTQAQLAIQQGEKLYAKNCRFVSRLNLCPICGAERALYESCHFESTDDALNGNAVYVGCDFDFYGGRPVFQAVGTGIVFIDCLFRSHIKGNDGEGCQYLTKEGGPVTLVCCRYESGEGVRVSWTRYPGDALKCYYYQVSQNGRPVIPGGEAAEEAVPLQGRKALEAYLFEQDGQRCVNVGNLLGGSDGWDPMGVLEQARNAGKTGLPVGLAISPERMEIVSGEAAVTLTARVSLFSHEICREKVVFSVRAEDAPLIKLCQNDDASCTIEGCNHGTEVGKVVVHARTESGLEAAAAVTVGPCLQQAPVFVQSPRMRKTGRAVTLDYELSSGGRADVSEVWWYSCDKDFFSCVPCGVSKLDRPLKTYCLTAADEGRYMKAVIVPRVRGSLPGEAVSVVMEEPVGEGDVDKTRLFTDFSDMPDDMPDGNQTALRRGRWTPDCGKPEDIEADSPTFGSWAMDGDGPAWKYGATGNGSVGEGLYQNTQGARLRYTPAAEHGGDMGMTVKADPAKTAGQGFGSAGQYMDFGIKFDTEKLTGYALRVIRVREASDGVAMALVEYRDGRSRYLTGLRLTSCFLTDCTIRVRLEGKKLTATASTKTPQPVHKAERGYARGIALEAVVEGNPYGGILIWHTGTPGTGGWQNTTMLHSVEVEYGD